MRTSDWKNSRAIVLFCVFAVYFFLNQEVRVCADPPDDAGASVHQEVPIPPPELGEIAGPPPLSEPAIVEFNGYRSIQVNVDSNGMNIQGDAANEPSIVIDPNNPSRMAIGWRQFDTIGSSFRQAGVSYSSNGGMTWQARPVLEPGQFRSDPVLDADHNGNFYYYSLSTVTSAELFKSSDGGANWNLPVGGSGGDKAWMAIDRTEGIGRGNIYVIWNVQFTCCTGKEFARFVDGGTRIDSIIALPTPSMKWGTLAVGPDGTVYSAGATLGSSMHLFSRSTNAQDRTLSPSFSTPQSISLGGGTPAGLSASPNPGGLLGQVWVATDHSNGPTRGNIYVLASINPQTGDPLDVMFIRSEDGGDTWSVPVRVNDDDSTSNAYQWFGTLSVAPNGRIDAVWYDTRSGAPAVTSSAVYYSWSLDGGDTWSPNEQVSPTFNSLEGHPSQQKIGDYIDMISDNDGVSIAYAATFNRGVFGEQDVYFLRIGEVDCNGNGTPDSEDIAYGSSEDCDGNSVPDECDCDCNYSGRPDPCDIFDGHSADCNDNLIPDVCDANFDGDSFIDDCDSDRDGDGVGNSFDFCPFTPTFAPVDSLGRPIGGNGDCVVTLPTFARFPTCMIGPHPSVAFNATHPCIEQFGYPGTDGQNDFRIDLRDLAMYQRVFEQVGVSLPPNRCP